jgi:hypothetical protein
MYLAPLDLARAPLLTHLRSNRVCVQSSRDDDVNPALLASYVDEGDGAAEEVDRPSALGEEGPIVASSGIRFLQYIGKYLQLMVRASLPDHVTHTRYVAATTSPADDVSGAQQVLLRPISFEIFVGVTHLFQYYVYTVYSFFGKEKEDPDATGNNGIVSTMSMVAAGIPTPQPCVARRISV